MRKENFEVAALTAGKFLLSFFDVAVAPFFVASVSYKKSLHNYYLESGIEKAEMDAKIRYLKKMKYVRAFTEGKEKYLELLPDGVKRLEKLAWKNIKINQTPDWDHKMRVVIFDVPEKLHYPRDVFRRKLFEMNFIQIQKSVYVFPFPCTAEISYLSQSLGIEQFVTIMVSDIIQGEEEILQSFLDLEILSPKDLQTKRK